MSHGPFGLGGGTLGPVPACCATENEAPISPSASESIRTRLILVFMLIPICLAEFAPASVRDGIFSLREAVPTRTGTLSWVAAGDSITASYSTTGRRPRGRLLSDH